MARSSSKTDLFNAGIRPAMNAGISCRASAARRRRHHQKARRRHRLALAQYRDLAAFSQFASDLDEATRRQLDRGVRVTEVMKQKHTPRKSVAEMALSIYAVTMVHGQGTAGDRGLRAALRAFARSEHAAAPHAIDAKPVLRTGGELEEDLRGVRRDGAY